MKKLFCFFAIIISVILFFSLNAHADIGPKPSVVVRFSGLNNESCYATLLSEEDNSGPYTKWDEEETTLSASSDTSELYYIYNKFGNYKDTDGFYFLQWHDRCDDDNELYWGYYPPSTFKVLLYFPEKDTYAVSGICKQYAFDSYFNASVDGEVIQIDRATDNTHSDTISHVEHDSTNEEKSNYYRDEIIPFFIRVILTVVIEILIAFMFSYIGKKQILLIILINIITQIILNITLYLNYAQPLSLNYLTAELIVLSLEAFVYAVCLHRLSDNTYKKHRALLYAITANFVSFIIGIGLSYLIPSLF